MKKYFLLTVSLIFISCNNEVKTENLESDFSSFFKNGDIMTSATQDPLGNVFSYPTGEASVTSQVKVWEAGFKSPWHYHPYTGVAYVIRGELTVKFDENTALDDLDGEKTVTKEQVFGPGSAFLGVANTWHKSSSTGDEDLIFQVTWLGEKGQPVKVSSNY